MSTAYDILVARAQQEHSSFRLVHAITRFFPLMNAVQAGVDAAKLKLKVKPRLSESVIVLLFEAIMLLSFTFIQGVPSTSRYAS